MRDDLLLYYERELTYLRQMGAQFAEKYPKIASRLVLEPTKCDDPHVERLLEAFAFLAARVHLKIDDDFPEITEALLASSTRTSSGRCLRCRWCSFTWTRKRESFPRDCASSAIPCSTPARWTASPASSAPVMTPRSGRSRSRRPPGPRRTG